ncbi:MAG: SymE family type I addiction module toxin [bacterium]
MLMLRLSGRWLEEAGFPRGRPIAVQVQEGRLVIEAL